MGAERAARRPFVRAAAQGALRLAVAQAVDIRVTGRPPSDTPLRVVARLTGWRPTGALATVIGHAAQSSLALTAALVARRATGSPARRAALAWTVVFNAGWIGDLALGAIEPPWNWSFADLVRDAMNKAAMSAASTL